MNYFCNKICYYFIYDIVHIQIFLYQINDAGTTTSWVAKNALTSS
jgi:hypothetical protein